MDAQEPFLHLYAFEDLFLGAIREDQDHRYRELLLAGQVLLKLILFY